MNKLIPFTPQDWRTCSGTIKKVPQVVYQAMYDSANQALSIMYSTREQKEKQHTDSKLKMIRMLNDWVFDTYPGYTMINSVELSAAEADSLQDKYPHITYGIYVKLEPISSSPKTPANGTKLIG